MKARRTKPVADLAHGNIDALVSEVKKQDSPAVRQKADHWWSDDEAAQFNSRIFPGKHHSLRTLDVYENGVKIN